MKILIVDDSKAMRMIIKRTLKQAGFNGHEFIEASDGVQATELVTNDSPDLVLSDWNMPEMNGIELLKNLRKNGNQVQLGFVTSESNPDTIKEAMSAGASFVITKPFSPESFQQTLQPVLN